MRANPLTEMNTNNHQTKWNSGREAHTVGTIFCVGRNYADHAKELGNDLPTEPMIFLKSRNSLVNSDAVVSIPSYSENMHFEAEMVLMIGADNDGKVKLQGVAVGLDFTLRDLQDKVKQAGHPWTKAKNFKGAAAISSFHDLTNFTDDDISNACIKLYKNGELRQDGNAKDMIFHPNQIISFIDDTYGLSPGDLIFTGTPKGVGPALSGDSLEAQLWITDNRLNTLKINIK